MTNLKDQRSILFATSISYILVILDTSIVNVALPRMGINLMASITDLQWVVNSYVVIFASLLLSGGALCDKYGARRIYLIGLLIFGLASLACGCSNTLAMLLTGRILQGVGAALLIPSSLALLTHAHHDNTERARAIVTWTSWGGVALACGPFLGGILIEFFDWQSIFLVNVPISIAGIWLTLRTKQQEHCKTERVLDVFGQLAAIVALTSFIATMIEGSTLGWTSLPIMTGIALSLLSGIIFVLIESKVTAPMLPLSLCSNRNFSAISYIFFAGALCFFGILFVLTFYFQEVCKFSPLETGLAFFPLSLSVIIGNKISGHLVKTHPPRTIMLGGAILRVLGFLGMLVVFVDKSYGALIVPLCLIGIGGGLGAPMSTSLFLTSVDKAFTGIASGISRATGQIGSALGIAIFGALISDSKTLSNQMVPVVIVTTGLTMSIIFVTCFIIKDKNLAN